MDYEAENIRIRHVTSGNAYCAGEKVVYHILPFYPLLRTLINTYMYVCLTYFVLIEFHIQLKQRLLQIYFIF